MTIWEAIILGAVQGATEFLPVSSDGHLVLAEHLLGLGGDPEQLMLFNLLVHAATVIAIIVVYREDLVNILRAAVNQPTDVKSPKFGLEMRDIWYTPQQARGIIWSIALATCATGVLYLLTEDLIDPWLTNVTVAGCGFLATSALLAIGMRLSGGEENIRNIGPWRGLAIGAGQYFAILPGWSRSGTTIAMGLALGLGRMDAAKFSFLMAIPVILLGFIKELIDNRDNLHLDTHLVPYIAGFVTALAVGIWAIEFLIKMLRGKDLYPFVYYTAAMGILTITLSLMKII